MEADPQRLQQVVSNLLTNALKFTPEGGSIDVGVERVEDCAHVVVRDTGIGITTDLLPRIFDRFQQGDSSTTRSHGGLGLGLAIVKHLVEHHGGHIAATSAGAGRGRHLRSPCRCWRTRRWRLWDASCQHSTSRYLRACECSSSMMKRMIELRLVRSWNNSAPNLRLSRRLVTRSTRLRTRFQMFSSATSPCRMRMDTR